MVQRFPVLRGHLEEGVKLMVDAFTSLRIALTQRLAILEAKTPEVMHGTVEATDPASVRLLDGTLLTGLDTLEPDLLIGNKVRLLSYGGFLTGRRMLIAGRVNSYPRVRAFTTLGTQVIPSTTSTRVTYSTPAAGQDRYGLWSAGESGFITDRAGFWSISASIVFPSNSTGVRQLAFIGATTPGLMIAAVSGYATSVILSGTQYLPANTTIAAAAFQNSGSSLTSSSGYISAVYEGD